jgi:hypothetical protein
MRGLPGGSENGENPIMPNSFEKDALIGAPLKLAIVPAAKRFNPAHRYGSA